MKKTFVSLGLLSMLVFFSACSSDSNSDKSNDKKNKKDKSNTSQTNSDTAKTFSSMDELAKYNDSTLKRRLTEGTSEADILFNQANYELSNLKKERDAVVSRINSCKYAIDTTNNRAEVSRLKNQIKADSTQLLPRLDSLVKQKEAYMNSDQFKRFLAEKRGVINPGKVFDEIDSLNFVKNVMSNKLNEQQKRHDDSLKTVLNNMEKEIEASKSNSKGLKEINNKLVRIIDDLKKEITATNKELLNFAMELRSDAQKAKERITPRIEKQTKETKSLRKKLGSR